jgi:hypothetical protein
MTLTLSGSAGITNPQGSTTNPSIGIGTNTAGIYWPNAAIMGFTVNGAEAMRVDQQGNVLIGTTTNVTASKLTVRHFGSNNTALAIGDTNTASSSTGLYFYTTSTANIAVGTGGALTFTTNAGSTEVMRITSTSNLGIGTTSVAAGNAVAIYGGNLQVGTTGTGIKFADGTYQSTAYTGAVAASGTLIRAPQVLTSGTSYTTPAGCNHLLIEMIGGGGGGGGCPGSSSGTSYGGGGGSSVFAVKYATVSPLTAYTYAIGGLGAGAGGGGNGSAGGTTSISIGGVTYSCSGGGGGLAGSSGVGGAVGAVGVATNMDYAITNLNNANAYQGGCVTTPYGINLGGFNITGPSQITSGVSGYGFGAGGGGAYNSSYSGAGAQSGGNGYQGMIRIWEYT